MSGYVTITATVVLPKGCYLDNNNEIHGPKPVPPKESAKESNQGDKTASALTLGAAEQPTNRGWVHGGPGHPIPPDQANHVILIMPPNYVAGPAETAADRHGTMALINSVLGAAQAVFDGT